MLTKDNKYTKMQLDHYNQVAVNWNENDRDHVVGSFDLHNQWKDYENLFTRIENQSEKIGLDFGCGPARNLVKYGQRFKRLDGADISPVNLEKAKEYTQKNGLEPNLYLTDGVGLGETPSDTYDFVMSTICLQHICVHEIRYSIFKDMFRVLKSGGIITAQMGYGSNSPLSVGYYENYYDAPSTNRACDTMVESPDQLEKDLLEIGFTDFQYVIAQTGPGDAHPNWIYFSAKKQ
jgi:ubiquinone/menaquinone biosynthesis C-methylase UbiE